MSWQKRFRAVMRWIRPLLDGLPFVGGDDARDQVEGEDFFDAAGIAVDGEGDSLVAEGDIAHSAAALDGIGAQGLQARDDVLIVRPRHARRIEHLVEDPINFVFLEHRYSKCGI